MARRDLGTFDFNLKSSESIFQEFLYQADKQPVDLTGGTFTMQIRETGAGGNLLSTLSTGNGRIVTLDQSVAANLGKFQVDMANADVVTEILTPAGAGTYFYDILYTSSGGVSKVLFGGSVIITEAITVI
jgi:hypothetical protein